jgi:hypothetical protein
VVPIHWATYLPYGHRATHRLLRDPGATFARYVAERVPATRVTLLRPGESLELEPSGEPVTARA